MQCAILRSGLYGDSQRQNTGTVLGWKVCLPALYVNRVKNTWPGSCGPWSSERKAWRGSTLHGPTMLSVSTVSEWSLNMTSLAPWNAFLPGAVSSGL